MNDDGPSDIALVIKAASYAAAKHRTQRRKDVEATPYINHPLALADLLGRKGDVTDPIILCAALLHDVLEDTETTYDELAAEFGHSIADVVMEVTDDKSFLKEERKRLQIANSATKSNRAKLVKIADKICNLQDIADSPPADWSLERKQQYFDWAVQVVAGMRGISPALEAIFDRAAARRPASDQAAA